MPEYQPSRIKRILARTRYIAVAVALFLATLLLFAAGTLWDWILDFFGFFSG